MDKPTSQSVKPLGGINARPVLNRLPKVGLKRNMTMILVAVLIVLAGVGTGWLVSGKSGKTPSSEDLAAPGAKQSQKEAGLADESTFRDSAEGKLEVGGIDGEGTHHLVRDGGPSQYVYLTSSVIDLESFAGKKVKVWGETISARKAGWLMDVGKIKVAE